MALFFGSCGLTSHIIGGTVGLPLQAPVFCFIRNLVSFFDTPYMVSPSLTQNSPSFLIGQAFCFLKRFLDFSVAVYMDQF